MNTTGFDMIGDVHGCLDELLELLAGLGYDVIFDQCASAGGSAPVPVSAVAPPGRQAIFLGDLVDRGPDPVGVVRLVMGMCAAGSAQMVIGNHDDKLRRFLHGNDVKLSGSFGVTAPLSPPHRDGSKNRSVTGWMGFRTKFCLLTTWPWCMRHDLISSRS